MIDMSLAEFMAEVRQFMADFGLTVVVTAILIIGMGTFVYRRFLGGGEN